MKIVILGEQGQLGRALLAQVPTAIGLRRDDVDITDAAALREALTRLRPDVVFNCTAYNHVDRAETEPEAAFRVNAFAVREMAQVCRDLSAMLVHFSTDYVFGQDETRTVPLNETDAPGPVSVYGSSKLTGETFARSVCP